MFKIKSTDGTARTGELKTAHGIIKTPFFMPVTTKATAKFISFDDLREIDADCVISNSYILSRRPGLKTIKKAGGLHKFCTWDKGIFTDSGGFQTLDGFFMQKSTDEGALMKDPYSGTTALLTPEQSMDIQLTLGSDVAMCLDDVPKHDDDLQTTRSKTLRTHSWARRCIEHHKKKKSKQLIFGIAQGGMNKDLRKKSIEFISGLGFDGIALGGLAIGEPISTMAEMIKASIPHATEEKPRYLMGVGSPKDLVKCIGLGVDCFDSTFPTQNGRHGTIFTFKGKLNILRKEFSDDMTPMEADCNCPVCKTYTRAYIHHLLKVGESNGKRLASFHNLWFVQRLIETARKSIEDSKFSEFANNINELY